MEVFSKSYLRAVVETQGELFDNFARRHPDCDTDDFITSYMIGKTRADIDAGQAYVATMNADDLMAWYLRESHYQAKPGGSMSKILPIRKFALLLLATLGLAGGVARADDYYLVHCIYYYQDTAVCVNSSPSFVTPIGYYSAYLTGATQTFTCDPTAISTLQHAAGYYVSGWELNSGKDLPGTYTPSKSKSFGAINPLTITFSKEALGFTARECQLIPHISMMHYTLAYDKNASDATGTVPTSADHYWSESVKTAPQTTFTRAGHTMKSAWNTKADGTGVSVNCDGTVSGETFPVTNHNQSVTLYAQWQANSYTAKIAAGEGGSGGCTVGYTYAATQQVYRITLPTQEGKKISGWTPSGHSGSAPTIKDDVLTIPGGTLGDFTMTPTWETIKCSLSLSVYAHGSAKATPLGSSFDYGTTVTITAEADEGYAFAYWETNNEPIDTNPYAFSITNDVAFRANFTNRVCKVTFDPQGGTCDETSRIVTWGTAIGELPVPTKVGRQAIGWFDAQVGGNEITQSTLVKQESLTAYAHYDEPQLWTITVLADPVRGGSVSSNGQYASGTTVTLTATPSNGYSFVRWADDSSAAATRQIAVTADATYTAFFTGIVYTVFFEANDPDEQIYKKNLRHGLPFGELPSPPAVAGKTFDGWYDDDGTGERITSESIVEVTENKYSFYGHWSERPRCYIKYNGNGATNEIPMDVQAVWLDESTNLSANIYGKIGYTFDGWATNLVDATNLVVTYTNRQEVAFPAAQPNETNVLYAVWATNRYTIAFDPGTDLKSPYFFGAMEPLTNCAYDTSITIKCGYTNYCSKGLLGWSRTKGADVAEFKVKNTSPVTLGNDVVVSNLTAEANATQTLYAVWADVGERSEAVGLTNAVLFVNSDEEQGVTTWRRSGASGKTWDTNHNDRVQVKTTVETDDGEWTLRMKVHGGGTLRFCSCFLHYDQITAFEFRTNNVVAINLEPAVQRRNWDLVSEIKIVGGEEHEFQWVLFGTVTSTDVIAIDDIVWTPGVELNPTNPPTYATEAEAIAAAANATVARPNSEVEKVISAESYNKMFIVTAVTNKNSTGSTDAWTLQSDLTPTVSNEVQTAVNEAATNLVSQFSTGESILTVTMPMTAGLYYGIAATDELVDLDTTWPTNWVLGTGTSQPLSVDRPSVATGFFRVRQELTPKP